MPTMPTMQAMQAMQRPGGEPLRKPRARRGSRPQRIPTTRGRAAVARWDGTAEARAASGRAGAASKSAAGANHRACAQRGCVLPGPGASCDSSCSERRYPDRIRRGARHSDRIRSASLLYNRTSHCRKWAIGDGSDRSRGTVNVNHSEWRAWVPIAPRTDGTAVRTDVPARCPVSAMFESKSG